MRCYICLWDMTDPSWPQRSEERQMEDCDYPRDAVTSHNGTALCVEHIHRLSTVDICGPPPPPDRGKAMT